jgi:transposase
MRRVDDRQLISGIIYVIWHGLQWEDAPRDYGPHNTFYNRFVRWSRLGVFDRIFAALAAQAGVSDWLMIDSTHLKANRTDASPALVLVYGQKHAHQRLAHRGQCVSWSSGRPGPSDHLEAPPCIRLSLRAHPVSFLGPGLQAQGIVRCVEPAQIRLGRPRRQSGPGTRQTEAKLGKGGDIHP